MRKTFSLLLFLTIGTILCAQSMGKQSDDHPDIHKIVVMEVIQTTSYTYVRGAETNRVLWLAVPRTEVRKGEVYYYHGGIEMRDFRSKELERVFPSIWFLNGLVDPELVEGGAEMSGEPGRGEKDVISSDEINTDDLSDNVTIESLYSKREAYAGKKVVVRGKVVKFNSRIMGLNWIHIKDGSGNTGGNDLTITTTAEVKTGDVITVEGDIVLDKDFGAGYFYELIMENGRLFEYAE